MAGDKELLEELGLGLMNQIFPLPVSEAAAVGSEIPDAAREETPATKKEVASAVAEKKDHSPAQEGSPAASTAPIRVLGWEDITDRISACTLCGLHEKRTQAVPGVGNRSADLMLVGEAPGEKEDLKGEPFVGQAGQLLDSMLDALRVKRRDVYITNVVKCRPPQNRDPKEEETEACRPYLKRQVELVSPKLIIALGRVAAQLLLSTDRSLSSLRRETHEFGGIPLVATYHPAYLLRRPEGKAEAWKDLCRAMAKLKEARL